jgi:hypothetical protein
LFREAFNYVKIAERVAFEREEKAAVRDTAWFCMDRLNRRRTSENARSSSQDGQLEDDLIAKFNVIMEENDVVELPFAGRSYSDSLPIYDDLNPLTPRTRERKREFVRQLRGRVDSSEQPLIKVIAPAQNYFITGAVLLAVAFLAALMADIFEIDLF